jgi:hypothetical protein
MSGTTITMPGRNGDLLFAMLIAREIAKKDGPVRVITSHYCAPAVPLLEKLECVHDAYALDEDAYRIEHTHFGAQPWEMPALPDGGELLNGKPCRGDLYHLGFRHFPNPGQSIPELAGEPYGIKPHPGPWLLPIEVDEAGPVAVPAANAMRHLWMVEQVLSDGARIRLIGTNEEVRDFPIELWNRAMINGQAESIRQVDDFLAWHTAFSGCSRYVGVNSGPAILAMGGGLPVVWPHRPEVEQERWTNEGCDVTTVDREGVVRRLRSA